MHIPRLGKLAKRHDVRTLKLADYGLDQIAAPPASWNLTPKLSHLGMMLNDVIGDCTCAGAAHLVQAWTAEAGIQVILSDEVVRQTYEAVSGYNPNDPNTDNGAVCLDVLNYWRNHGIGGHKITGYAEINPKNQEQVRKGVFYFGGLYCGFSLPATAQGQTSWQVVADNGTGDAQPGSWGGHCVPIVAYDMEGVSVITWGQLLKVSWGFVAAYCDEAYPLLSADLFEKSGKSPEGFNLAQLQSDLKQVTA